MKKLQTNLNNTIPTFLDNIKVKSKKILLQTNWILNCKKIFNIGNDINQMYQIILSGTVCMGVVHGFPFLLY